MEAPQIDVSNINFPGEVNFSDEDFALIEELVSKNVDRHVALLNKLKFLREGLKDD